MLPSMIELALGAGEIINDYYESTDVKIKNKGKIDLVTEVDLACEKYLTDTIRACYPDDDILAEEGTNRATNAARRWIIDPLDGTTNFAHRFPFIAVSIALEIQGIITYGVVYNPILDELFSAQRGFGSQLNGTPIQVSTEKRVDHCLIGTGFPYDRWENADFYTEEYKAMMCKTQGLRRAGAAAIDLCYVACGKTDGFFERKLKPWDMAAGTLIIEEAGGMISQISGNTWNCMNNSVLASNGKIHQRMITILASAHTSNKK